ncbi:hypothetical protein CsatB_018774 [Cannabis sativa]
MFLTLIVLLSHAQQPSCYDEERNALIHFNQSFKIDCDKVRSPYSDLILHPKTLSWGSNGTNCCSWEGVECDMLTGRVICLNLSSSCLYGSIHSNSTLFQLVYLQELDLHYNNFTFSPIPNAIGIFSELKILNLRSSFFQGQIPLEFSLLSKLSFLDLSYNVGGNDPLLVKLLKLKNPNLRGLVKNLTSLDTLFINYVDIGYELGDVLANLTSLRVLGLGNCGLYGPIPSSLGFHNHTTILPWSSLHLLELQDNLFRGQLPIPPSSVIHYDVSNNILSGEIPSVICNLSSILVLDLSNNNLSGDFPLCSGNGISDSLLVLNLKNNSFHGTVPLQCQHESELRMADFSNNRFQGKLQRPFTTCMNLEYLDFSFNQLSDVFPSWLGSFPRLKVILMRENKFHGVIGKPQNTTSEFQMLQIIDMSRNYFIGPLPYEYMFSWNSMKAFKMSNLTYMKAWENITFNSNAIGQAVTGYDYSTTIVMKSIIPQENQFHTFENNSFEGNQGLCGEPLSKKCEALLPPSAFNKDVASESAIELDWKFILAGLVSGFAIGVSLGEIVIPRMRLAWANDSFKLHAFIKFDLCFLIAICECQFLF